MYSKKLKQVKMNRREAKSILERWKGNSLSVLNSLLRNGSELTREQAILCRTLKTAIKRHEGHHFYTVWRDDHLETQLNMDIPDEFRDKIIVSYFNSLKGKIFRRPEFMGTSTFRWKHTEKKFVLKIILPKQSGKGVYLSRLIKNQNHTEQEVLLGRNSKFKVIEVDIVEKIVTLKKVKRNTNAQRVCFGDDLRGFAHINFPEYRRKHEESEKKNMSLLDTL
ncbi:MAG: ADP-ribosyltransferase [Flavobacteriales bacterium]|nr:ADP-ribosyltransferase [Flavobacteriales bacterium]